MDTLLVKIFATALTFSQVATAPDAVKTRFDPTQDRQQVIDLLREAARDRGATVLVVTHDPRLEGYADRVFHMADGELRAENPEDTLVEMAGIDDTAEHVPLPADPIRVRLADPVAGVVHAE